MLMLLPSDVLSIDETNSLFQLHNDALFHLPDGGRSVQYFCSFNRTSPVPMSNNIEEPRGQHEK